MRSRGKSRDSKTEDDNEDDEEGWLALARSLCPPRLALARPGSLALPALAHALTLPAWLTRYARPGSPWLARSARPGSLASPACLLPPAPPAPRAAPAAGLAWPSRHVSRLNEALEGPRGPRTRGVPIDGVEGPPVGWGTILPQ